MQNLPNDIKAAIENLDHAWKEWKEASTNPSNFANLTMQIRDAKRRLIHILTSEVL